MKSVYVMLNTKRKSIVPTVSSSDKLHIGLLMQLHPGISLLNGLIGAIMYIIFVMLVSKFDTLQPVDLSTLRDMDLPFLTGLNIIAIVGYKPVVSELIGLFLGCCLCIMEMQTLRTIGRTATLRSGLIATLYRKCDVEENIPACRKFRTIQNVDLLKRLSLTAPILAIGIVIGAGFLIAASLAFVPSALAAIFRKKLLLGITDDIAASQDYSVSTLQYQYLRTFWQAITSIAVFFVVIVCVVLIFVLTSF